MAELQNPDPKTAESIFDFQVLDIDGQVVQLSKYKGFVTYIVNVASEWGLTKTNYTQLAELHSKYAEQGLRILAFPCNQFENEEPGSNQEIKEFARAHGAQYDLFSKTEVNGERAHPLFKYLRTKTKPVIGDPTNSLYKYLGDNRQDLLEGDIIRWNFSKFLCDKQGQPVARYSPSVEPIGCVNDIEKYLKLK